MLAGWICHLRGLGTPVTDARADEFVSLATGALPDAVQRVLATLDPAIGADTDVVTAVISQSVELASRQQRR